MTQVYVHSDWAYRMKHYETSQIPHAKLSKQFIPKIVLPIQLMRCSRSSAFALHHPHAAHRPAKPYRSPTERAMISLTGPRRRVKACSPSAATRSFSPPAARTEAARPWLLIRASSAKRQLSSSLINARTSEIVALTKLLKNCLPPVCVLLDSDSCSALNQEELVPDVTFHYDIFTFGKCTGFEYVGYLGAFLGLEGSENRDFA